MALSRTRLLLQLVIALACLGACVVATLQRGAFAPAPKTVDGFWGPRTASVDWCEENYVHSRYIAEFWNTISSLPIVTFGVWATFNSWRFGYLWRFTQPAILITFVGIGSIWFHGTLKYTGQALDELTMVYCVTSLLYVVLETEPLPRRKWLGPALFLYNAAFTVVYLTLPSKAYFSVFVGTFVLMCFTAFFHAIAMYRRTVDQRLIPMFWIGAITFLGSFLFLWIPDNLYCSRVRRYHLHAWFHIGSGIANYWFIVFVCQRYYEDRLSEATKGRLPRASVPPTPLALRRPDWVDRSLGAAATAVRRRMQLAGGASPAAAAVGPGGAVQHQPTPKSAAGGRRDGRFGPPSGSTSSSLAGTGLGASDEDAAVASSRIPVTAVRTRRARVIADLGMSGRVDTGGDGSSGRVADAAAAEARLYAGGVEASPPSPGTTARNLGRRGGVAPAVGARSRMTSPGRSEFPEVGAASAEEQQPPPPPPRLHFRGKGGGGKGVPEAAAALGPARIPSPSPSPSTSGAAHGRSSGAASSDTVVVDVPTLMMGSSVLDLLLPYVDLRQETFQV